MLLHIGAAYVVPGEGSHLICVDEKFVLPPVSEVNIPEEHQFPSSNTVKAMACHQCRFQVAMMARYSPHAIKKILCHNCYETLSTSDRQQYAPEVFSLTELERQVMFDVIELLKGQRFQYMDTPPPTVSTVSDAPVFLEAEMKEALKFMVQKDETSVKCNNDRANSSGKQKLKKLDQGNWKAYYWSTTVDQIRNILTDENMKNLGDERRQTLETFREKVENVMAIMRTHPDSESITQFTNGRGVLMLFGGAGTSTQLHLDIGGALTYQFMVSSRK